MFVLYQEIKIAGNTKSILNSSLAMANLEEKFLNLCQEYPDGITDQLFLDKYPEISKVDLVLAINKLSSKGVVELFKKGSLLYYRAVHLGDLEVFGNLEDDEKIVYQCIKASDNKGIWTKDLKLRTNLHQTIITKVLKNLENKGVIKTVKSVKNPTRKVYMLASIEPSQDLTGGPWFSENELDIEFIEELCKICLRFVESKSFSLKDDHIFPADYSGYPTTEQVHRFLRDSRVTTSELEIEDVNNLLDRLVFDGCVVKLVWTGPRVSTIVNDDEDDEIYAYRALPRHIVGAVAGSVPCGQCPALNSCNCFGPITPSSCGYYSQWLTF